MGKSLTAEGVPCVEPWAKLKYMQTFHTKLSQHPPKLTNSIHVLLVVDDGLTKMYIIFYLNLCILYYHARTILWSCTYGVCAMAKLPNGSWKHQIAMHPALVLSQDRRGLVTTVAVINILTFRRG